MALDIEPNAIATPSRDTVVANYKRDYALRNPNVSSTDALVDADARTFADGAMPIYAIAITIANNVKRSSATGDALTKWSFRIGGNGRLAATGAIGFVAAGKGTAGGGVTIFANDKIEFGALTYRCLLTTVYSAGDPVPVQGVDVGPLTNQAAGLIGTWSSPRPGMDPSATVLAQSDGSGLSGGHLEESDDELQTRLDFLEANPPASGNEAEYIERISSTPAVPVGASFVFPDVLGPGSVGVIFCLRASTLGGNRIPNPAQIALVLAWLSGRFPWSDNIFVGLTVAQPIDIGVLVTWSSAATGWADLAPWPTYASSMVRVTNAVAPTITSCRLINCTTAPPVGATIGFYDAANAVFRRKRILTSTVVSGTTYDVTFDVTNGVSDTTYTPLNTQPCCPWSDSLDTLVPAIQGYFDGLGPGEQYIPSNLFDPGLRRRRQPAAPGVWPSIINNRLTAPIEALPTIQDSSLATPAVGTAPTVGTPGISAYLFTTKSLTAFPQ